MDQSMDLRPPIRRSWLRLRLGKAYYAGKRYLLWCSPKYKWAKKRQAERPAAMWPSFLWLTVLQILTAVQLTLAAGEKATLAVPGCFLVLTVFMWLYAAILRLGRCVGFELETIAFYLSTLSLAVTASSAPGNLPKQLLAVMLAVNIQQLGTDLP